MASNIEAYFVKQENCTLTPEQFREKGILASEASNGFIELAPFYRKMEIEDKRHTENDYEEIKTSFLKTVVGSLKPNTPPLMKLSSSSFGGFFDDPIVILTFDSETLEKTEHSDCQDLFSQYYDFDNYFDAVGFSRHTSYIISDQQLEELKAIVSNQEQEQYHSWLKEQDDLSPEALLKMLLVEIDKKELNTHLYSYSERDDAKANFSDNVKFIRMRLGMDYDRAADRIYR